MLRSVITGTGSFIPSVKVDNSSFSGGNFFDEKSEPIPTSPEVIVRKFQQITGIAERRYAGPEFNSSDLGASAAKAAILDSGIDPETIDQIIVAHNYGDIPYGAHQSDTVPSVAARIKNKLGIQNPNCVAYDILFGCPGWIQGLIQADLFCRAGAAGKCLIIGTETLSRVIDPHDRDSMIFADGAGACILEIKETGHDGPGILSTAARSDSFHESNYINFGKSYNPAEDSGNCYIKMKGRKVYEYALKHVPEAMKLCLDKSGQPITALKKIFIHQANEKMDEAIIKAFYELYNHPEPEHIMPMSIHWLGNSSVATVPTLFDLVLRNQVENHSIHPGDLIMFASVGAGMNINAVCYRY